MKKTSFWAFCVFWGLLLSSFSLPLHSVEMIVWHRTIGTNSTGNGALISKMYSPDSGYTQFSLASGQADSNSFLVQNTNELACAGALSQGTYTVVVYVSNGVSKYEQSVQIDVVAGSVYPRMDQGREHVLLLTNSGEIRVSGKGDRGQLGTGGTGNNNTSFHVNSVGSGLESEDFINVIAADNGSFFVTRDGKVFVCGENSTNQLLSGSAIDILSPTQVTDLSGETIIKAVGGDGFSCFLTAEGEIFSAGGNNVGQLGVGDNVNRTNPTSIQQNTTVLDSAFVLDIAASNSSMAAVTSTGIYTWGYSNYSQLGHGNTTNFNQPTLVSFGSTVDFVAQGLLNTFFAVTSTGDGYATGRNHVGQLGLGNENTVSVLTQMSSVFPFPIVAVAADELVVLALTSAGDLYFAGLNLGNSTAPGSATKHLTPTLISASSFASETITQISKGNNRTLVGTASGGVYGIGFNSAGQLGRGDDVNKTSYGLHAVSLGSHTLISTNNEPSNTTTTEVVISSFSISWSSYTLGASDWL